MILRVRFSNDKDYLIRDAAQEAYYSEGQEFSGFWFGKAAAKMGLTGRVGKEAFGLLAENIHPITGGKLTPRNRKERRIGADFTFNCPKSVSLAYMWTRDERILQAVLQAVRDTITEIEPLLATRVREGGRRDGDRTTGNLVGAEFVHLTARPENGVPDPHLHVHCYVFNVTFDPVEQRWKAAQFGDIMNELDYFDSACASRMATNLKALGLEIISGEKTFEIAGFCRELIEKFSNRTKRIMAEAKKRGLTTAKERDGLAALTREKKIKNLLIPEIEPLWWSRLSPEDKTALNAVQTILQRSQTREPAREKSVPEPSSDLLGKQTRTEKRRLSITKTLSPVEKTVRRVEPTDDDRAAVAFALEHIFERASTVTERQLVGEALRSWSYGKATLEGIKQVVAETPLIRLEKSGRKLLTTAEVLVEENRIVELCRAGKNALPSLNSFWKIEDTPLNDQQQAAVRHVLNSPDWITGIAGKAGTGKTTLLHEAKRGIEAGMTKLLVLAPTSEAARDVLRKEGFQNAETVAKLLSSERLQTEYRGAVWWIDEAGLLSTRLMDRVLAVAKKAEARLILVGDTGQHHAVERGQAFELLEKFGGMTVASVDEIQRQRGRYKRFVEHVAAQETEAAFDMLEKEKWIFEGTGDKRHERLADDYLSILQRGETARVVSPTHVEGREVTAAIRAKLKEAGWLHGGRSQDILRNLSWTTAEKSEPHHYKPGMVVQVNRPLEGFTLGEQLEVVNVRDGLLRVRTTGSPLTTRLKALPLAEAEKFGVYERDAIEICEGEQLRITGNGRSSEGHQFNNGSFYKVELILPAGDIVLDNGWHLAPDFKHCDHGYATTSHGSQGKTVDWVLVSQSGLSFAASDAKQFYVSVSRARQGVKVYTDDMESLKEAVSQVRERPMAMEVLQPERKKEMALEMGM